MEKCRSSPFTAPQRRAGASQQENPAGPRQGETGGGEGRLRPEGGSLQLLSLAAWGCSESPPSRLM